MADSTETPQAAPESTEAEAAPAEVPADETPAEGEPEAVTPDPEAERIELDPPPATPDQVEQDLRVWLADEIKARRVQFDTDRATQIPVEPPVRIVYDALTRSQVRVPLGDANGAEKALAEHRAKHAERLSREASEIAEIEAYQALPLRDRLRHPERDYFERITKVPRV